MTEIQPKLRLIDTNELDAMAKMTEGALKSYLINALIPALSSPEKTREIVGKSFNAGKYFILDGGENGLCQNQQEYINSLIKE